MVAGLRSLQPAVQYLAGELPVDQGAVLPLMASHNTVWPNDLPIFYRSFRLVCFAGKPPVDQGAVLPLMASHNTVRPPCLPSINYNRPLVPQFTCVHMVWH